MSSSVTNHDECSNDGSQQSPRISNTVPFVNGLFLRSPPSISMSPPPTSTCPTTQDLAQFPEFNWTGLGSNDTTFHGTSAAVSGSALFSSDLTAFNPNFANHQTGFPLSAVHGAQCGGADWGSTSIPSWAALFSPDLPLAGQYHGGPQCDLSVAESDQFSTAANSGMMSPNLDHVNQVVCSFNLSLGSSLSPSIPTFSSAPPTVPASQPVSMNPPQFIFPALARHATFPPCNANPVSSIFDGATANVASFLTPAPSTLDSAQCQVVAPADGRVGSVFASILPCTGGESVPSCLSPLDEILMSASGSQSSSLALISGATAEPVAPVQHEPGRRRRRSSGDIDPALTEALSTISSTSIKRVRINSFDSSIRQSPRDSLLTDMSVSPTNLRAALAPPAPSSSSSAAIASSTELLAGVTAHACGAFEAAQQLGDSVQFSPTLEQFPSSPIPICPSTIGSSSAPSPIAAIVGVPFPPPITPGESPQITSSVCVPGRESSTAPVGSFDMALSETCFAVEGEGGDNALETELKKPRFEGDLYTPRIVRGSGRQREAKCHVCNTEKWLNLKTSAYWYHMQYYHGISSASGHPFFGPIAHRWIISLAPSAAASGTASDGSVATRLTPKTRKTSSNNRLHKPSPMPPATSTHQGFTLPISAHSPIILPSDPLFPLLGPLPNPHFPRTTPPQTRVRISVAIEESALCPRCNGWITLLTVRRPSRYDLLTHIMAAAGMSNVSNMDIRDGLLPSEIAAARNVSVMLNVPPLGQPLGFTPTNCQGTGGSSTWFRHAGRCISNEVK